jgi:Dolichyl-phosphate-mannose-protein mannosyltransferase
VSPYSNREQARALQAAEPERTPRARQPERAPADEPQRAPRARGPERALQADERERALRAREAQRALRTRQPERALQADERERALRAREAQRALRTRQPERALQADERERALRAREAQRALRTREAQRVPRARAPERAPPAHEPGHDPAATAARARVPPSLGGVGPLGRAGQIALAFALLSGLVTHGYHLFQYPLYSTDEGIYVERAWSVIREGRLAPQTYFYDHAPGGWLVLAAWEFVLPRHFETFGNPIDSGRVLMLLLHLASVFFLFQITRRFSGSLRAAIIATFFFNFSPLAIYYQREVLLDNIMVFWLLLSIYLLLRREGQLFAGLWSGVAFGISVVSKENAIFFAPTIYYLLSRQVRWDSNRHFAQMFWLFGAGAAVFAYFLFATLKGELLPPRLSFDLSHPPQGHVSLLYEMWYQIHRNQGALFQNGSYLWSTWQPKDGILLAAGTVAMASSLYLGWQERKQDPALLVAGTLALEIAFYLARGSVILDFYVLPLIPLYALNIALITERALSRISPQTARLALPALSAFCGLLLFLPSTHYFLQHGFRGQPDHLADVYNLPLTNLQDEQIAWIRQNIPPTDKIITDEDIWVALHDVRPYYPYAQSHWNAASDPKIRDNIFHDNPQDIDYIVLSNQMKRAMEINNGGGQEQWILSALDNATPVWQLVRGDVSLAIYKVQK